MGGPRSTIELHPLPERPGCLTAVGERFKGGVGGSSKFSQEFEVFAGVRSFRRSSKFSQEFEVFRFKFQGSWACSGRWGDIEMVLLVSSTSTALRAEYEFEYVGSEGGSVEEMSHAS